MEQDGTEQKNQGAPHAEKPIIVLGYLSVVHREKKICLNIAFHNAFTLRLHLSLSRILPSLGFPN